LGRTFTVGFRFTIAIVALDSGLGRRFFIHREA